MITKASEEYLKTMYVLKKQNGNIRVTDIANKMNCTKPSVNKALNNLKEEKLVKYETYGIIELTEQGENLAQKILEAYDIVYLFLKDVLEEKVFLDGGRNKEYFILSFSKCRDSITMWSEFGNKTGYNIGFDGKKIIKRIEEDNIIEYHGFVLYEKAQQKEAIRKILNTDLPEELEMSFSNIIEAGAKNRNNEIYRKACRKFQKIAAVYAMFFKHSAFKEEEEYRFIFKKKAEVLYREKDGFLIPYIEIPLSNRLLPIKEVVIAPKNHMDLAKKGVEYMMKEKGYEIDVNLSDIRLRY